MCSCVNVPLNFGQKERFILEGDVTRWVKLVSFTANSQSGLCLEIRRFLTRFRHKYGDSKLI